MKINVEFDRIKPAQAIVLKKMFEDMERLGNAGCSRFVAFYADGDGDFRPKVKVVLSEELPEYNFVTRREVRIPVIPYDYDKVAWALRNDSSNQTKIEEEN